MVFIMIADPLLNPSKFTWKDATTTEEFKRNTLRNAANTLIHEMWDHALPYFKDKNYQGDTRQEHENFHGQHTINSPSLEDYDSDPKKFKDTSFGKNMKEIDADLGL